MNETKVYHKATITIYNYSVKDSAHDFKEEDFNNWWALLALVLVVGTAAGNILVCLAITWERRLQNVTNYFLMSLAITDLMVAILVMPLGILTLVRGYFPLPSVYCLAWICLDVLFCTASIMHLCTISVDRYLSLRYPMKFGRNKSRKRVILKIVFVWLLSIAMSLPLSLMYSKDQDSMLIDGTCQIPDPLYKFIGSIICFYIPLLVMLVTYALTVRLLAHQRQNLGTENWSSGWLGGPTSTALERKCTWRKLLKATRGRPTTPQHGHSATSTDTELTTIDTHELWIQETEPAPCTMSALGQFGAEMLKLSRGLHDAASASTLSSPRTYQNNINRSALKIKIRCWLEHRRAAADSIIQTNGRHLALNYSRRQRARACETLSFSGSCNNENSESLSSSHSALISSDPPSTWTPRRRRASTFHEGDSRDDSPSPRWRKRRNSSFHESRPSTSEGSNDKEPCEDFPLPPPCTCPYFGEKSKDKSPPPKPAEVRIITSDKLFNNETPKITLEVDKPNPLLLSPIKRTILSRSRNGSGDASSNNIMVTWESPRRHRRGSSFGSTRTSILTNSNTPRTPLLLRRSATLRQNGHGGLGLQDKKNPSSPCLLQRYNNYNSGATTRSGTVRSHHSRNSSVISRNSSRHGRIIRLEQKATKVLGVVFFTFVILWAPFFVLNLLPIVCAECEKNLDAWVFHFVTWLGYASSLVNPIFYTIFNKVFRQAFKKVLLCKYRNQTWRPHR